MGRGNSELIKDNQSKDNKNSKNRTTLTKNSTATRSKAKGLATKQEKNANLSPSKLTGRTNHHLTVSAASPTKNIVAVTPNNRKPIDVDGEDSATESIISLIDDNKKGGKASNDAMNASGLITAPTCSTSTENVVMANFSSIVTGNDAGNKDTNDNTVIQDVNVSMGGVNLEHSAGEEGANSKSIDQIERKINDLPSIIGEILVIPKEPIPMIC